MNIRGMIKDNERLIDCCQGLISRNYLLSSSEIEIVRSHIIEFKISNSLLEEILKM